MGTVVVIFGGSCFMGRRLVAALLAAARTGVVVVNRGRRYWGCDIGPRGDPDAGGRLHRVRFDLDAAARCDDGEAQETAAICALATALSGTTRMIVTAFSLDHAQQALASLRVVQGAVEQLQRDCQRAPVLEKYILISSDSVYDPKRVRQLAAPGDLMQENDAARYRLTAEEIQRSDKLAYGPRKVAIEVVLSESVDKQLLCVLRLPDVVGPFDDSSRWWATSLWGLAEPNRCYFPQRLMGREISVVDADDVVSVIMTVAHAHATRDDELAQMHGAFHLACAPVALGHLVQLAVAGIDSTATLSIVDRYRRPRLGTTAADDDGGDASSSSSVTSSDDDTCEFYPSVAIPPLCTRRAKTLLAFAATPIEAVAAHTNAFFAALSDRSGETATAAGCWPEYKRALRKLPRWVRLALRRTD
jgi:nucleoside-diphosphate-sugar epimerase